MVDVNLKVTRHLMSACMELACISVPCPLLPIFIVTLYLSASDICWLETFIILFVPERFDVMRNEGYYKMKNFVIYTGYVDLW
jgi:hypothetical protein